MIRCIVCDKELTGGVDTFGEIGLEMCQEHYLQTGGDPELGMTDSWYGLAPHFHTLDSDGNIIIGGTKFLPLPAPDESGLIAIDGLYFRPDVEAEGCGIYFKNRDDAYDFEIITNGLMKGHTE